MPCLLKPDPRKVFCARGKAGDQPLVRVDGPPTLKITQATFNSDRVPVLSNNRIQLPALRIAPTGTNALNLVVEGVNPTDVLTLLEQCERDDQEQQPGEYFKRHAPAHRIDQAYSQRREQELPERTGSSSGAEGQ
jgi:hypothetical protein